MITTAKKCWSDSLRREVREHGADDTGDAFIPFMGSQTLLYLR
jgi:hypothetical protein